MLLTKRLLPKRLLFTREIELIHYRRTKWKPPTNHVNSGKRYPDIAYLGTLSQPNDEKSIRKILTSPMLKVTEELKIALCERDCRKIEQGLSLY
jgi:hypothetical protein